MPKLTLQLPINNLSFGFCSYNILKKLYRREIKVNLFAGGDINLEAYDKTEEGFFNYIKECSSRMEKDFSRNDKGFRLWHIRGAESNILRENNLFTFHELDALTETEVNILNNQNKIFVSSKETKQTFEKYGVTQPVIYAPLGFDDAHFRITNKKYHSEEQTVFSIFGKFEKRKHHAKAIQAWIKRFGKDRNVILHTHIYNVHFSPEQNNQIIAGLLKGERKPFNVNLIPYLPTLSGLNEAFNATDIVMDMSGGEGFSLPSFHCLALGKHGVIHNCSAMKDWANDSNATMVESNGKEEVYDGVFFAKGTEYNQGNLYSFDEDAFIHGCELALNKKQRQPINFEGLKLSKEFSWERTANIILENV